MPKHPVTAQHYNDRLKDSLDWKRVPGHLTVKMLDYYRSLPRPPPLRPWDDTRPTNRPRDGGGVSGQALGAWLRQHAPTRAGNSNRG
jgi:hypothetical protein